MEALRTPYKIVLIAVGYVAALAIASAAVAISGAEAPAPDAQASGGMNAFGAAILFVGVFGVCALVPTVAAGFVLRSYIRRNRSAEKD